MLELTAKPDAAEALQRMERWWLRENDDRAILTIGVETPSRLEAKTFSSPREAWFDFDYRIERALADVEHGCYVAETFPCFEPNLGPDIVSTIFGLKLEFEPSTSWSVPIVDSIEELLSLKPDFGVDLWQDVEKLQRMAIEAGKGKWITLFTDLHPNMDVLAALMGQEPACIAVADEPDQVARAVEFVTPVCVEAYNRQIRPLEEANLPIGCWIRGLSRHRTYVPECDFSILIGPKFFKESVLPTIREEMKASDRNIYHLDGPGALRHLDAILEVPEIHAIQWVYGAGNGPARNWLPVYKKILDAGKGIRVEAEDCEDIRILNEELGSKGVWYAANFSAPDLEAANRIVNLLAKH